MPGFGVREWLFAGVVIVAIAAGSGAGAAVVPNDAHPQIAVCIADPTTVEPGEPVTLDASASDADVLEFDTDGDGEYERTDQTDRVVTVTYEESGTYEPVVRALQLEDTDPCGTVTVNSPPSAALSVSPDPATAGEAVTFDARQSSDPDGEIVEYRWDFTGDGTIDARTTDPTTTHTFRETGFSNPEVTVVDDVGATTGIGTQLTIQETPTPTPKPTQARCDVPDGEVQPGERVLVDASGSINAEVVRFDIDGDGDYERTNRDEFRETLSYSEPDTYRPEVRAETDQQSDTAVCGSITVVETGPPVPPWPAVAAAAVLFVGVGLWARTKLTPENGNDNGDSTNGDDRNRAPKAEMEYVPPEPAPGRPVTFDGSMSFDPDPDDRVVGYRWTVGDRESTGPRFVCAFPLAGEYEVALEVTDRHGATGRRTERITVEEKKGELVLDRVHPDAPGTDGGNLDEEYIVFENAGEGVLELDGWTVHDAIESGDRVIEGQHTFEFGERFELHPGATVTVHTGTEPDGETDWGETSDRRHLFWDRNLAVWNDDEDIVLVRDHEDNPVVVTRYVRVEPGEYDLEDLDAERVT